MERSDKEHKQDAENAEIYLGRAHFGMFESKPSPEEMRALATELKEKREQGQQNYEEKMKKIDDSAYGMVIPNFSDVVSGRTWKHTPDEGFLTYTGKFAVNLTASLGGSVLSALGAIGESIDSGAKGTWKVVHYTCTHHPFTTAKKAWGGIKSSAIKGWEFISSGERVTNAVYNKLNDLQVRWDNTPLEGKAGAVITWAVGSVLGIKTASYLKSVIKIDKPKNKKIADTSEDSRDNKKVPKEEKKRDAPEDTKVKQPTPPESLTHDQIMAELDKLQGKTAKEMRDDFFIKYDGGVRPIDTEVAFKKVIQTSDGKLATIDQDGLLRIFENQTEIERTKQLVAAKAEKPLHDTWKRPDYEDKLDTRNQRWQEDLAEKAGVPKAERAEWIAANTDEMTGLLNRSVLKHLEGWILEGKKVAIGSFDADHFGALNKLKGMGYGDYLIKVMGGEFQRLERNIRSRGYKIHVGRMGGEEFVPITTAPQRVLNKELENLNRRLMKRVQKTLKPDEIKDLQGILLEQKGIAPDVSVDQIGSATSAVSEFNFNAIDVVRDPAELARYATKLVDQFLEHAKNQTGRNQRIMDVNRDASSNAIGLVNPERRGVNPNLNPTQRENMRIIASNILSDKYKARMAKMPELRAIYNRLGNQIRERNSYSNDFFRIVNLIESPTHPTNIPRDLLEKIPNLREEIDIARADYMRWAARHEPSLNTLNPATFREILKNAGYRLTVDPAQFKCLNEILGHGFADRLLELNVQNTIDVLREFKITEPWISKNLSKLDIALPKELPTGVTVKMIQRRLEVRYQQSFDSILDEIDAGSDSSIRETLYEWLSTNKTQDNIINEPLGTARVVELPAA